MELVNLTLKILKIRHFQAKRSNVFPHYILMVCFFIFLLLGTSGCKTCNCPAYSQNSSALQVDPAFHLKGTLLCGKTYAYQLSVNFLVGDLVL